jgi:hypothetical protein
LTLLRKNAGVLVAAPAASAASNTTAWQNGAFAVNAAGVVSESDVVLGQPNTTDSESLPLGNGSLGVAAWAANGFIAQLNRSDTMPNRLSPGQVEIPGLEAMTSAANFAGTLDLYSGVLNESGGGMTMQAWVPAGKDELVVNVTGTNPATQETADLYLWSGRTPTASGAICSLAQTWVDNSQTGNSGQTDVRLDERDRRGRAERHRFRQIVTSAGYTFNPSTGNTVTISVPSGTSAQYVELNFTGNTGWDAAQLSEFEILP